MVSGLRKLDALTRILEVEPFEAVLIFVRTKIATTELAERLDARGYAASALNGDMPQQQREQMIERLKGGKLDILVATDVAARGLDVDRITHVINFDIPNDAEAYIHRIGRTGRAGRNGEAILFVAPASGACSGLSNRPRGRRSGRSSCRRQRPSIIGESPRSNRLQRGPTVRTSGARRSSRETPSDRARPGAGRCRH